MFNTPWVSLVNRKLLGNFIVHAHKFAFLLHYLYVFIINWYT